MKPSFCETFCCSRLMCTGRQNGQDIGEAERKGTQGAAAVGIDLDQTASHGGFYRTRADRVMIGSSSGRLIDAANP